MSKKVIVLLMVFSALLVAVVTCPQKQLHEDAVSEEVKAAISSMVREKAAEHNIDAIWGEIGATLLNNISEDVWKNRLRYKNYFVVSITYVDFKEKEMPVSIGVFGHAFTTIGKKEIKKYIAEELDKL